MCEHSRQLSEGNLKLAQNRASNDTFTHLHLHSSYSLLDGAIRIPDLMKHLKSLNMDSVALTDHGNLYGAFEFFQAAKKENIKPILGCEFYVAPGKRQEKTNVEGILDGSNYHLVLLARNQTGYQNLIRLSSSSFIDGFYRKPRIDYELLSEHASGLVCLSACIGGEIQNKVIRGKMEQAQRLAGKMAEIMDPGCFFLELQDHGLKEEQIAAQGNLKIAQKLNLPLCLTNDSHYLERNHQQAQEFLLRINQKKSIQDALPFTFNSEFYVKSSDEMARLFPDHPQAYLNTKRIAEMIDLNLDFSEPMLPDFSVPENSNLEDYLFQLAKQGLCRRYGKDVWENDKTVRNRFEYEYNVIKKTGFSAYFLIVQDFINHARKMQIPVGPGRGSAAGSLISYALGITDIDPLHFGLLFERFLNPDRNTLPDIDIDFCTEGREQIIDYVRSKYGENRVGQIITHGKMTSKACLKDVARVLQIPFQEANQISEAFPKTTTTIAEGIKQSKEFATLSRKNNQYKQLFDIAQQLEGNIRQVGIHAAGVVIAPKSLEELIPLALIRQKDNRVLVSQYDMDSLSQMGMVKIDFLGLQNLTIIGKTLELIKSRRGKTISFVFGRNAKVNDQATYQTLCRGDLKGVFQLESRGMREFLLRFKPDCFEDIIALLALFRPGPLKSGMADAYIHRKNGTENVEYEHPDLEDILKNTYGVILFQEQVMEIGIKIGGLTALEADQLRVSMGKKNPALMEVMKEKFINGAVRKNYSQKFAEKIFNKMEKFAGYGFNKSHSAAYACIVYQTAYLKTHFTIEYMVTLLNSSKEKVEDLSPIIRACNQHHTTVLGPSVNTSMEDFTILDEHKVLFGLSAIKNVGEQIAKQIVKDRQQLPNAKYSSIDEFFLQLDLRVCNKRVLEALIKSGSFDCFKIKRKFLLENLEELIRLTQLQKKQLASSQTLFSFENSSGNTGTGILQNIHSVHTTKDSSKLKSEYSLNKRIIMEKDALGFYLSGHPLNSYQEKLEQIGQSTLEECTQNTNNSSISLAVVFSELTKKITRRRQEMIFITCSDLSGITLEGIIFPRTLEKLKHLLKTDFPFWIEGIIRREEDQEQNSIIINNITPLAKYLENTSIEQALHIKFKNEIEQTQRVIADLKQIFILQNSQQTLNSSSLKLNLESQLQSSQTLTTKPTLTKSELQLFFHLPDLTIKAQNNIKIHYTDQLVERLKKIESISEIYITIGKKIEKKYETHYNNY